MTKSIEYEQIEVPTSDEKYYTAQGWVKYGMSMGRNNVVTLKMRRERKTK